jgi:hypothetical protein
LLLKFATVFFFQALRFVAPDTVTVLQKFVPPQGNRAQILRVLRVEGTRFTCATSTKKKYTSCRLRDAAFAAR